MIGDFHLHSHHSDGRLDPSSLMDVVAEAGVTVAALTDHDTTAGHAQAAQRARERGVQFVPGIEMTTFAHGRVIHVLGLGVHADEKKLVVANRTATDVWDLNQRRWVESLSAGIDVRFDRDFADHPVRLPVLIERLCKRGVENADPFKVHARFRAFFDGLPGQAYERLPTPAVAATIIRDAGGVALLAHPNGLHEAGILEELLHTVDGLEAMYLPYMDEQREALRSLALRSDKLYSCGSDYHGYFTTQYRPPLWEAPKPLLRKLGL
ncbi:MAG TPA: PHP domain-containing protein [Candidatus Eremiobacteraceae bacterium]|nr:PHP domain-containing protein [Candidatus Eremiobacteraceae bacterium]